MTSHGELFAGVDGLGRAGNAGRPKLGSLFSGVGGLDLAVEAFFDAETAWHVEYDPEPSKVLAAHWPGVPNLGDIIGRDPSIKAAGNSVCPQQAYVAIDQLWARVVTETAVAA